MPVFSNVPRVLYAVVGACFVLNFGSAEAHQHNHSHSLSSNRPALTHLASAASVIQCVTFAKQDAGIEISGNARDWWSNAAGVYDRGSQPETGSVLSFEENGRMPLGHVAVVSGVEDARTIVIDQSHWNSRGITRDVVVKDVSEDNDWSEVRVQLGRGSGFGSIYPTHGFIYPRPDRGASAGDTNYKSAPATRATRAKWTQVRPQHTFPVTEVAEASQVQTLDLTLRGIAEDSPSRALR